ncbi:MFS transporter [Halarsenatibacter silvermanii]|uniref:Predicted arabinose efflux permease, MFS family n=1 Tax=Halarsenatibacter silvermanii TaxID=321763 RepID=A0A1G9TUR2_9FIRM|nr:MFS transporter [Halarsenatibacter silvermanii]SDM51427.1 Predicted arabinose efflux permease, MFS family [Halarsenatibacter silvermanii]
MSGKNDAKTAVLLLGAMGFWVMGDNYAASPMLVDIAQDFGLEIGTAAMVVVAYMIPFGLFTFIFGPLGDRYGKLRIITIASFGTAIFSSLGALAFNFPSLLAVRAINGGFAAAILPVSVSYIGDIFNKPRAVMNAIGQMMGSFFLGAAAATAIGGGLSFIGSWRLVYLTYGVAELVIVVIILKSLQFDEGTAEKLSFRRAYSNAFKRPMLLKTVALLFLIGFAVFGSFTYLGDFFVEMTGYNILVVGLILTLFGLAAFTGGRNVGNMRQLLGPKLLILAGLVGIISWLPLGFWPGLVFAVPALIGFGLAFVTLQSTILVTAQKQMPRQRGTVMSLASFNMFVGGGTGVTINRLLLNFWGYQAIYLIAGTAVLIVGFLIYLVINTLPAD